MCLSVMCNARLLQIMYSFTVVQNATFKKRILVFFGLFSQGPVRMDVYYIVSKIIFIYIDHTTLIIRRSMKNIPKRPNYLTPSIFG